MAEMTPLRRRMIEDMRIRNLSPVTQRCYLHAVTSFSRHFNCSPDRAGADGSTSLSGASRLDRCLMAGVQPNDQRPALLLRRDAQLASR
jgi:hypothetical protein